MLKHSYQSVLVSEDILPGIIAAVQTFGGLAHWHPHVHWIATAYAFSEDRSFIPLPDLAVEPFLKLWEHKIFKLLLKEGRR